MKRRKMHLCIHRNGWAAMAHPSVWAGFAGVLTTTGAQLAHPYSAICLIASALCSFAAILIRTPQPGDVMKVSEDVFYDVTTACNDKK